MAKSRHKYSKRIADTIIDLRRSGKHTNAQICEHVGISAMCLLKWRRDIPEFLERWEEVEEERLDNLGDMALSGLAVLLTKHEYEEEVVEYKAMKHTEILEDMKTKIRTTTTEYKPIQSSVKKAKKIVMPNTAAVIFTLTNRKSEEWKNKQDHSLKAGEGTTFFSYLQSASQAEPEEEYVKDDPSED